MKQTYSKRNLRMLVTALVVVAGLFAASTATAQASTYIYGNYPSSVILDPSLLTQQHNWVVENDALAILENAVDQAAAQLPLHLQGSPQHQNLMFHITYYKIMLDLLEKGNTTEYSAQHGIDLMTGEGYGLDAGSPFTKADLNALYLEAVDMLSI